MVIFGGSTAGFVLEFLRSSDMLVKVSIANIWNLI